MAGEMMKVLNKHKTLENEGAFKTLEKSATSSSEFARSHSRKAIDAIMSMDLTKIVHDKSNGPWQINNPLFHGLVYSTILLNTAQMGLAIDLPELNDVWLVCEHVFTAVFTFEMLMKIWFLEKKEYFACGWNRLDFLLVVLSVADNWVIPLVLNSYSSSMSNMSLLRILRILRIGRVARLMKVFKELWIILKGVVDSLRTIFWVVFLLLLTLYAFSILCVEMMGRKEINGEAIYPGFDDNLDNIDTTYLDAWNNYVFFGTICRSMYTLFNVATLTEVSVISRPIAERQPGMAVILVGFIIFTTFGLVNVIIGVIVDNTLEAAKAAEKDAEERNTKRKLENLERIRDIMFEIDTDRNGVVTLKEVEEGWDTVGFKRLVQDINFPSGWTARDMFALLDQDGNSRLCYTEFIKTFYRLLLSDSFQQNCCTHASLNDIKQRIASAIEPRLCRLESLELSIESRLDQMDQSIKQAFQDMRGSIGRIHERLNIEDANAVDRLNKPSAHESGNALKASAHESGGALKAVIYQWGTPFAKCSSSCLSIEVAIPPVPIEVHESGANGRVHELKLKSLQQESIDAAIDYLKVTRGHPQ